MHNWTPLTSKGYTKLKIMLLAHDCIFDRSNEKQDLVFFPWSTFSQKNTEFNI